MKSKTKKKILILAANPKATSRVRFDEEIREIKDGLERAKLRDKFELKDNLAVRYKDLRRALLDNEPQIVHFIGHGDKDGLKLEDNAGNASAIPIEVLSELFELCSRHIESIILSACYSAPQANAISEHIENVIGMHDKISDNAAIAFAVGFYDALAAGESIEGAFKFGRNAIHAAYPDDILHLIPVLRKKGENSENSTKEKEDSPNVICSPLPTKIKQRLQPIKIPQEAVCPYCNEKTSFRICPTCHSGLPHSIGKYKNLIFTVIGPKESGKSHYLSILIEQIMNEPDFIIEPLGSGTIKRYREDYYNPIFKMKETLPPTRSGRENPSVKTPLIYLLSVKGKGIFSKKKIKKTANIYFFDTAGVDLESDETMAAENKYIFNSSGIILLLDPLQFQGVREKLPPGTPLPSENTEIDDVISRTANLIRKAKKLEENQLIDIPIALTFSKIDALEPLLDPSSGLNYQSKHSGSFDIGDFEAVNSEMETMTQEWNGANLLQQLRSNFKYHAFFGMTALGCNPHDTQKISGLRPRRVKDPFLWLLWQHKLIAALKKK